MAERRSWAAATPVVMAAVPGWMHSTAAAAAVAIVAAMSAFDPIAVAAVAAARMAATAAGLVALAWAVQLKIEMYQGWVGACCSPASGA